ncbi:hypothetical protein DFJ58DRAFT_734422 [Suillus subalutaceus]|uniref:uncharacterized protein n=1 Tax=Suillus subalutaceus TaxID=48586 RepID=UPI001B864EC3|nr:uncharacterized protein DFJ58DRAFT_734422 [Suillus subalutaceus]KAG1837377.1 hypothetical protein DFJ58DRAFT_734422 [Suillus subalutaceus]
MNALTQLDDYNRLLMAISENDIPRIHQVINIALRNGASIREVVNKLEDALEGTYRPRGYGADDFDIATLVFRLGGRQLLFALNQKLNIPSLRTLRANSTFTSLMPTIGPIRNEQFDENIQTIVVDTRSDSLPLRGVSFMIDEIALEEMAVHFRKFNKVGGLCWKHSHVIDPVLRTYDSAVSIAQKLHEGHVHLGKELTVIGVSCFGEDEIYPILAAPTCKTEDASDMERILAQTVERWNSSNAVTSVGPAWSFATDGDATRRAAGHKLFVKTPLPPDSPLYGTLINMPGLNLFTGAGEVTLDFDFKHIFKRICTLIRSPAGIVLNNGRVINSMMLARYLVWLPAYEEAAVTKLLYPDDPQDVPRAVELMLAIIEFSHTQLHVTNDSFSLDIDTRADVASIHLLSKLLESILIPFIRVDLSLAQQFEHLSRYSHLAFSFFHAHRRSFMSYQLYYDTQTMVKNAVFSLAKQQSLDPYAPFFLGDVGDDPLEILFGRTRMIGGHNSACSYAQALDRLAAAKDIDGVFKRHPELDPGHRRLKLTRHEGVDHINREIWKGDIISGRCDLPLSWRKGHDDALSILTMSQLDHTHYAYSALFTPTSGIDMLRPFGHNKYLGISNTDDELGDPSQVPRLPPPIQTSPTAQFLETVLGQDDVESADPGELQGEIDDEEAMLTFQEALIDDSPTDAPPAQSNQPLALDPLSPPLPQGPGISPDDYLLYNRRWIHKQTVCRLVINKDFISKSLNRLERVRAGYTKVNKRIDMSAGRITEQNLFLVGDIFLTILRSAQTLSIGVLRSTTASLDGISRSSINTGVMKAPRTTAKITGQLLSIVSTRPSPDVLQVFLWDGGYVTAHSLIQGSAQSTDRVVVVTVPGSLVEPVNPDPTFIRLRNDINVDEFLQVNGGQSTWQISRDALQVACDLLWAKAVEMNVPLKSIAVVTPSDETRFPYRRSDGTPAVISMEASNLLGASAGDRISVCPLCESSVLNMRNHMGQHILRALSNTPEEVMLKEQVGNTLPCGFCGHSGQPECAITITTPAKGATTWDTKCAYQHSFRYASADVGSKNQPCRNVPLKCELCYPTLPPVPGRNTRKTYSVPSQDRERTGVPLPASVWKEMRLTDLEQTASRIPKTHWQPSYIPPGEIGKENVPLLVSRGSKRAGAQAGPSRPSKKARTTVGTAVSVLSA